MFPHHTLLFNPQMMLINHDVGTLMQEHYCLITKSEIPNKQCNMTVMFLSEYLVVASFDATPQGDIFGLNRDTTSMYRTHIHLLKHLNKVILRGFL